MNSHLVTEDLDLRVGPVQRLVAAVVVAVRVDLDHQRKTLDPLLRGEVCTQTVDRDEDLPSTQTSNFLQKNSPKYWQAQIEPRPWTRCFSYQTLKKHAAFQSRAPSYKLSYFICPHPPLQRHGLILNVSSESHELSRDRDYLRRLLWAVS